MKVKLLNPSIVKDLYANHGQFACICYDTPDSLAEKVGEECQSSGHMSGSRCEYIKFLVTDVDRGTAEQCLRHEIGTAIPYELQDNYYISDYTDLVINVPPDQIVKNMASFRYIDKDGFGWVTPVTIKHCENAKAIYDDCMRYINNARKLIKEALMEDGIDTHQATQDANFVLPRATTTALVIGFTPEALIHFMHKRLCLRAQEFVRDVARAMVEQIYHHNIRFCKELVPHCEHLLWCPEKNSCGRMPTKAQVRSVIEKSREDMKRYV